MFRRLFLRLAAACLLACLAACAHPPTASSSTRLVGVAQVDITPDYPVRLNGYGGRRAESEGIVQRIRAKALAIGDVTEKPAVLITVDNCGVPEWIRTELVRRLAWRGVISERLAICSSHTHSAPMLNGVLPTIFGVPIPPEHQRNIDRYTGEFTDKLEQVALAALSDRQPASLAWSKGEVKFASNRRKPTPTGYQNAPNPAGPVDHELPLLRVTSPDGKLRAVLASYACHCTTTGFNKMHADWAGCAQLAIERAHPGVIALTAIGCGADQNPNPRGTYELADKHGQSLADEVARLLKEGKFTELNSPLSGVTKRIELPFDKLPTRAEWEAAAKKPGADGLRAQFALAKLDKGETIADRLPYLVQVWNFGPDLAMVFLPGEVVVDYGLRIKREFDGTRVWVNSYANDVPCYIPSRRVWDEGGYEAAGAMVYYNRPARFDGTQETRIMDAVQTLMPKAFAR
ncbi:MAG: neutral/alkaline non-lysosomal ceramidase N-terminal domain-containing protein [Verrucomicrobia bacterium]|nr:neutral/alkaline non-lysosomal ceramidase N-terminal domain-containing protein [Verrucomicrobiota bacterium]